MAGTPLPASPRERELPGKVELLVKGARCARLPPRSPGRAGPAGPRPPALGDRLPNSAPPSIGDEAGQGCGDRREQAAPLSTSQKSPSPLQPENAGATRVPGGRGLPAAPRQAAQKHTDTGKALLQRNHLVSLEKWLKKTQLWRNEADTAFGQVPNNRPFTRRGNNAHRGVYVWQRLRLHANRTGNCKRKTKQEQTKPKRTLRVRGVPFALHFRRGPAAPGPPVNQGRNPAGVSAPTSPPRPGRGRHSARAESGRNSGAIFLV